jgi:hypothetical protein
MSAPTIFTALLSLPFANQISCGRLDEDPKVIGFINESDNFTKDKNIVQKGEKKLTLSIIADIDCLPCNNICDLTNPQTTLTPTP